MPKRLVFALISLLRFFYEKMRTKIYIFLKSALYDNFKRVPNLSRNLDRVDVIDVKHRQACICRVVWDMARTLLINIYWPIVFEAIERGAGIAFTHVTWVHRRRVAQRRRSDPSSYKIMQNVSRLNNALIHFASRNFVKMHRDYSLIIIFCRG